MQRVIGLGSALAMIGLGTAFVTPAGAAAVACGATITRNTTLTSDVGPCNHGDAVIVVANNIAFNLNGHKVFSTAPLPRSLGTDPQGFPIPDNSVGIHLKSVSGVRVQGGTVQGFSAGVAIEGGGRNTVSAITAQHNLAPCLREGQDTPTQLPGKYGDGIVVFSSSNNQVKANVVQGNGPFSNISIVTETDPVTATITGALPSGNVIRGNRVRDGNSCRAEMGIRVEGPGATHNTVSGNDVSGSNVEGIAVLATFNIDLSVPNCNPFPDDPSATDTCPTFNPPQPTNQQNVIRGNHVSGNSVNGPARGGIGLLNFFPYLGASGQPSSIGADNNTVEANLVERNFGHGIAVNSSGNHILNNVAINNNKAQCPRFYPPSPPNDINAPANCYFGPFGGVFGPRFDLYDGNGVNYVPRILPPPPPPFEVIAVPGPSPCDANVWSGNIYGTAFPRCTTANGHQVVPAAGAPTSPESPATASAEQPAPTKVRRAPSGRLME